MNLEADVEFELLDDAEINHEVVRGPLPNGFRVRPLLRPDQGALKGTSSITRPLPMMPKLGNYDSGLIEHSLLDRKWQAVEMNFPNVYRRTKALYVFPIVNDQSLMAAYQRAIDAIADERLQNRLRVLDRDEEVRRYYGHYVNFHPRVNRSACEIDRETVRREQVARLLDSRDSRGRVRLGQISRLPRTMTNFFLNMYRRAVEQLQQQIEQLQQEAESLREELAGLPPGSPRAQAIRDRLAEIQQLIAAAQAEIAEIEPKIEQLEQYQARLDEIEEELRRNSPA